MTLVAPAFSVAHAKVYKVRNVSLCLELILARMRWLINRAATAVKFGIKSEARSRKVKRLGSDITM